MTAHSKSRLLQSKNQGTIPAEKAPKAFLGATCVAEPGSDSQLIESVYVPAGWKGVNSPKLITPCSS